MPKIIVRSLRFKLVCLFLIVALTPIALVGYLSFSNARKALQKATLDDLRSVRDQGKQNILAYLERSLSDMTYLARNPAVQSSFKKLKNYLEYASYFDHARDHPDAPLDVKSEEYRKTIADMDPLFTRFLESFESDRAYEDLLLIVDSKKGIVMYTAKKLADLGTSLTKGTLEKSALAGVWAEVVETKKPVLKDFSDYGPSGKPNAFLGVPVFGLKNKLTGVLVLRFGAYQINKIMEAIAKIGRTGDAFIVGKDFLLRSQSRRYPGKILQQKVETRATQEAVQGNAGLGEITGGTGSRQLNAWTDVGIGERKNLGADFDWAIVANIDSTEAFAPVSALKTSMIWIAAGIGLAVAVLAFLIGTSIAKPITDIAGIATRVSSGDLMVEVPDLRRGDEVGSLADAVRAMVVNLREQIAQLGKAVNTLSSGSTEISSFVSQLSTSTLQTSSAVAETTTTVEQVKQSARVASEKAENVAQRAKKAVEISESGRKAAEQTVERMSIIRGQMESIGQAVVRLSDHSQDIEDILGTVQDLADQSNLLAVNASIEAARAGDQGKGFGVVAQEIKSLADQSREATHQIRGILDDTRKWIGSVVEATEQASTAVEAGVSQSIQAGQSIGTLAKDVGESAEAASVIEVSSQQQTAGVDQVAQAMVSIEQAVQHNSQGAEQIKDAIERLLDLSGHLSELVGRYKV